MLDCAVIGVCAVIKSNTVCWFLHILNNILKVFKKAIAQLNYSHICCWYSFELPRQVEAIQMSTNNMFLFIKNEIKEHGLQSKVYKIADCALIGLCAVIRSNTICWFQHIVTNIIKAFK